MELAHDRCSSIGRRLHSGFFLLLKQAGSSSYWTMAAVGGHR